MESNVNRCLFCDKIVHLPPVCDEPDEIRGPITIEVGWTLFITRKLF
jgi:hypothetical protein